MRRNHHMMSATTTVDASHSSRSSTLLQIVSCIKLLLLASIVLYACVDVTATSSLGPSCAVTADLRTASTWQSVSNAIATSSPSYVISSDNAYINSTSGSASLRINTTIHYDNVAIIASSLSIPSGSSSLISNGNGYHEWRIAAPSQSGWLLEFKIATSVTSSIAWTISRAAAGGAIIYHSTMINSATVTECEINTSGDAYGAHVYGLYWSSGAFAHLYIDGVRVCSYTTGVPTLSLPTLSTTLSPCSYNMSRCGSLPPWSYTGPYTATISYYRYRAQSTCAMSSLCGATCAVAADVHYCNRIGDACACPYGYAGSTCSTVVPISGNVTYIDYGTDSTCTGSSVTSVLSADNTMCYPATDVLGHAPLPLNHSLCPLVTSALSSTIDIAFTIVASGDGQYSRASWTSDVSPGNCTSYATSDVTLRSQWSTTSCSPISLCAVPSHIATTQAVTYGSFAPTCSTPCTGNRQCDLATDTCVCITGYTGSSCTTPVCTEDCSLLSNTTCGASLAMCTCNNGYYGWDIANLGCPDRVPAGLSYAATTIVYNISAAVTSNVPAMTSGSIGSHNGIFTVSPSLPAGWMINATTGVITPNSTLVVTTTAYTITFCNYIGCTSTSVTYTVQVVPVYGFTLSRSSDLLQRDLQMVDNTVATVLGTNTAAYPITYALASYSLALPIGITLDASTGALTGTPIALQVLKRVISIVASNYGGYQVSNWTVLVGISPPSLTYTRTTAQLYRTGVAITSNTVATMTGTNSVDIPIRYSISPSLSTGLTISTTTGAISGTPTVAQDTTVYTVNVTNTIGWASTTLTITTAVAPSSLTYSVSAGLYRVGSAITSNFVSSITATNTANTPLSYAISPSLPTGLSMSTTTGTISGTPTVSSPVTSYNITATNAVGVTWTVITILTMVAPSALTYTSSSLVFGLNAVVNNTVTSITGDTPLTWSISPPLPGALFISATDGRLTGVATVTSPSTTYTVNVSNTVGSTQATLTVSVLQTPSGFSYPQSTYIWRTNAAVNVEPTLASLPSGSAVTFSTTSTLPTGIALNATSGALYGTPTVVTALSTVTIMAANSVGNVTAIVSLVVAAPLTALSYTLNTATYKVNTAITNNSPSLTGTVSAAVPVTYTVSPSLPTGLSIASATGIISGTPSVVVDTAVYVVRATNVLGNITRSLSITVAAPPTALSYTVQRPVYLVGSTIVDNVATVTGTSTANTPITFGIAPSLVTGLSLSTTTGTISGAPSVASNGSYVVTATNAVGSTTVTLVISSLIASSNATFTYVNMTAIYGVNDTITANPVASLSGTYPMVFSSVPPLPTGLVLDSATGEISGTCTESSPAADYTLVATNAVGSVTTSLSIACWLLPSHLVYATTTFFIAAGDTNFTSITPSLGTLTTGTSVVYSSTTLPTGLTLDPTDGTIAGVPGSSVVVVNYAVTITATNDVGYTTAVLRFTIQPQPYAPVYPVDYTVNQGVFGWAVGGTNTITPSSVKQTTTAYSISPSTLPTGLSFSTVTGIISGTASGSVGVTGPTTYTITSSNLIGSASTTIMIATCYQPTFMMLSQANTAIIVDSSIPEIYSTVVATNTDAIPLEFWSVPTLPTGVTVNNRTGVISGAPTTPSGTSVRYTIYARNPGGSIFSRINLQPILPALLLQPYGLSYSDSYITYQTRIPITSNRPTIFGTSPITYSYNGDLPAGLAFSTTTGYLTGTPTGAAARTFLTITAVNVYGSCSALISVAVIPVLAVASYPINPATYVVSTSFTNTPVVTAGTTPITWSITPTLPTGLTFSATTGVITGISAVAFNATIYTVTLSNLAGSTTIQLTLGVASTSIAPADFAYTPSTGTYPGTVTMKPSLSAGTSPITYAMSVGQALPLGLTLSSTTGIISGIPRVLVPGVIFALTATNPRGSTQTTITIEVTQLAPVTIFYPRKYASFSLGTTGISITPSVTPVDSNVLADSVWSVYPALPTGLSFDTTTGAITGSAITAKESQSYFVSITNPMGTTNSTIYIEVPSAIALPQSTVKLIEVNLPGWLTTKFANESIYYRFLDSLANLIQWNQTYLNISGTRDTLGTGNVNVLVVRVYIRVVGGTAAQVSSYLDALTATASFSLLGFPTATVNTAPTYVPPVVEVPVTPTTPSTPFFDTPGGKAVIAFLVIILIGGPIAYAIYYYITVYRPAAAAREKDKPPKIPSPVPPPKSPTTDGSTKKGQGTFAPTTASNGDHGSAPPSPPPGSTTARGEGEVAIELGNINYEHKGEGEVAVTISPERPEGYSAPSPTVVKTPPPRRSSAEDMARKASGLQPLGSPALPPRRGQNANNPPLPPRRASTHGIHADGDAASPSSSNNSNTPASPSVGAGGAVLSPAKRRPSVNGQPAGNPPLPPRRHSISQSQPTPPAQPVAVAEPSTPPPAPELDTMVPTRRPSLTGNRQRGTLSGKAPSSASSRNLMKSPSNDAIVAAALGVAITSGIEGVASPKETPSIVATPSVAAVPEEEPAAPAAADIPVAPPVDEPAAVSPVRHAPKAPAKTPVKRAPSSSALAAKRAPPAAPVAAAVVATPEVEEPRPKSKTPRAPAASGTASDSDADEPRPKSKTPRVPVAAVAAVAAVASSGEDEPRPKSKTPRVPSASGNASDSETEEPRPKSKTPRVPSMEPIAVDEPQFSAPPLSPIIEEKKKSSTASSPPPAAAPALPTRRPTTATSPPPVPPPKVEEVAPPTPPPVPPVATAKKVVPPMPKKDVPTVTAPPPLPPARDEPRVSSPPPPPPPTTAAAKKPLPVPKKELPTEPSSPAKAAPVVRRTSVTPASPAKQAVMVEETVEPPVAPPAAPEPTAPVVAESPKKPATPVKRASVSSLARSGSISSPSGGGSLKKTTTSAAAGAATPSAGGSLKKTASTVVAAKRFAAPTKRAAGTTPAAATTTAAAAPSAPASGGGATGSLKKTGSTVGGGTSTAAASGAAPKTPAKRFAAPKSAR